MKIRLIMPILIFGIITMGSPPAVYSISNQENMIDIKEIETLFSNKGTMIEFSRSPKYQREIEIVRDFTGVAEYESISEGVLKYADIGIALLDIDGDGQCEILAYVRQSWFCSGGGSGCNFIVLRLDMHKRWKELLNIVVPERTIFVLPTRNNGFLDLLIRNGYMYPYDEEWCIILSYNQYNYDYHLLKNETLDYSDRSTLVTISKYDPGKSKWKLISARKASTH